MFHLLTVLSDISQNTYIDKGRKILLTNTIIFDIYAKEFISQLRQETDEINSYTEPLNFR